jgi:hypothetical protein
VRVTVIFPGVGGAVDVVEVLPGVVSLVVVVCSVVVVPGVVSLVVVDGEDDVVEALVVVVGHGGEGGGEFVVVIVVSEVVGEVDSVVVIAVVEVLDGAVLVSVVLLVVSVTYVHCASKFSVPLLHEGRYFCRQSIIQAPPSQVVTWKEPSGRRVQFTSTQQ